MLKMTKLLPALATLLCIAAAFRLDGLNVDTDNNFGGELSGIGLSDSDSEESYNLQLGLAPFAPYNIAEYAPGYIIHGTVYSAAGESPGTVVIDPPNSRIAFIFGFAGTYITTPTDSYNFNIPNTGGICLEYAGFGYDDLVASFELITLAPGSTARDATYNGLTKDSFSCNQNVAFSIRQERIGLRRIPVMTQMFAAIPAVSGLSCVQAQAYFIADKTTLDTRSDRNPYFVFPATCSNPIPLCSTIFPCGNPCAIDCCPAAAAETTCTCH